jgi:putative ABC transport system permease protein
MGLIMLMITLVVVALVLYFVINSSIIRRKRELGIFKAVGFTTFQLMNQISVSFMVPVILGSAVGSVLGAFYTNPMMSVAMSGMGVMKAGFLIDGFWIGLFGVGVFVFSYGVALLVSWRIRKISAYLLVTE